MSEGHMILVAAAKPCHRVMPCAVQMRPGVESDEARVRIAFQQSSGFLTSIVVIQEEMIESDQEMEFDPFLQVVIFMLENSSDGQAGFHRDREISRGSPLLLIGPPLPAGEKGAIYTGPTRKDHFGGSA